MKLKILGISVVGLVLASTVFASDFITPQNGTKNVSTSASETHKNLYAVGGSVTIDSSTQGDLVTAGGILSINGPVQKELIAAGGNITVNGSIADTARIAGGNITLNSPIGGDLLTAGGNVIVSQKATVNGDFDAVGGNVSLDSAVNGNAKISGGTVTINGTIKGNLEVNATKSLTFGPNSSVTGLVVYHGVNEAVVMQGAKVSNIQFTRIEPRNGMQHAFKGFFAIATLFKLIGLFIAGLLFYWLFPKKVQAVVAQSQTKTLQNLGIGFLIMVAAPIAAIILMVTVIGAYVGFIVMLGYLLLLLFASVFMLYYIGSLVYGWLAKNRTESMLRDLLIGSLIALILSFIPVIGWLVILIVFLIALGATATSFKQNLG